VSWNCVSEFQNAGFNIYRRAPGSSAWMRVNAALISGRVTNPDAKAYSFFDWAPNGQYEYSLECISIQGDAERCAMLDGTVSVDSGAATATSLTAEGFE